MQAQAFRQGCPRWTAKLLPRHEGRHAPHPLQPLPRPWRVHPPQRLCVRKWTALAAWNLPTTKRMGSAIPHEGEAKGSLASPSAFEEGPAFGLLSTRQLLRLVAPGIPIRFSRVGSAAFSGQFGFKHGDTGL